MIRCVIAERRVSSWILHPWSVVLAGVSGKQTNNNHYDHYSLYYYICGKFLQYRCSRPHKCNKSLQMSLLLHLCASYICSRQWLLRLWKMYYICGFITLNAADFYYVCGLLRLRYVITLLRWRALGAPNGSSLMTIGECRNED